MTFKTGKQKFSKDEIIDILKRNISLYRDEEEFVQYVVDLAMYLVEHRQYSTAERVASRPISADDSGPLKRRRDALVQTDHDVINKLKKHATRSDARPNNCRMCGAPNSGKVTCPNCGNMSF